MVQTEIEPLIQTIEISTPGRGFHEFSKQLQTAVNRSAVENGICHVFVRHTSASLLITENADHDVRRDLERFMTRLVPDGDPAWAHDMEGPDDMPAHIRSVLTCTGLSLPIRSGRLALGTWQGVFLWEHRTCPHHRRIDITILSAD